jgi:hypothetical protein
MSRIVLGKSDNENISLDLDTLLRTRLLVQANSGGGKSWLLRRLAEQLFGKVQVILIDPEGEFATLREKFDYVLVGKDGETPADPRSAVLVAHKLLELRASAVCDIFEMKPSERHRWVKLFLDGMIDAPKKLWHPVVIIVDEASVYCPEKGAGDSEASEAMISLCTRGRKRGFAAVFASQRLGNLRKDAAAQFLNVLIGPTFIDIDRKRAGECLGVPPNEQRAFFQELKVLEPGKFFALGRAITKERTLVTIGKVTTTHPEPGSSRHAVGPPPAPEKIKALLPKLADLPKAAEEQAKTVAELNTIIRALKVEIRSQKIPQIDESAITRAMERTKQETTRAFSARMKALELTIVKQQTMMRRAAETLVGVAVELPPSVAIETPTARDFMRKGMPIHDYFSPVLRMRKRKDRDVDLETKLKDGAIRMLTASVRWNPNGITLAQMKVQAGIKTASTLSTYKNQLIDRKLMEGRNGLFFPSDDGIALVGDMTSPSTTQEVMNVWLPKFKNGVRRMLSILVNLDGEYVAHDELRQRAQIETASTYSTYKNQLKVAHLVVEKDGAIAANRETLFL